MVKSFDVAWFFVHNTKKVNCKMHRSIWSFYIPPGLSQASELLKIGSFDFPLLWAKIAFKYSNLRDSWCDSRML